jgi:23S rRNA (cytosine1962-C5)-methyltransferase
MPADFLLLSTPAWKDYELLDSGNGQKLERFGHYLFIRPEHQAFWQPVLTKEHWENADAHFQASGGDEMGGKWQFRNPVTRWKMQYQDIKFHGQLAGSRHVGVFPEQASHWDWVTGLIRSANRPVSVLNLFGYTGLATLTAAQAGAKVTHVDASKKSINWARENQTLSKLDDRPIRWILDDALKFVQREARRQVKYDGIILDPPKFGRGPKGEVWECFEMLPDLLAACRAILSKHPLFVVMTAYAIRASALSLYYGLEEMMKGVNGSIEVGELVTKDSSAGRLLSMAIFGRWRCE